MHVLTFITIIIIIILTIELVISFLHFLFTNNNAFHIFPTLLFRCRPRFFLFLFIPFISAVFYYIGSILYQKGYIDKTLDVGMARYKKGGALKWIGFFTSLYSTCALAYSMITAK